jgi:hypothetical protein
VVISTRGRTFLLAVIVAVLSAASTSTGVAKVVGLTAHYRVLRQPLVFTTGRYTFLTNDVNSGGRVLDERRLTSRQISAPPDVCGGGPTFAVMGGPYLVVGCSLGLAVYRLPDGPWQVRPTIAACSQVEGLPGDTTCDPIAVGREWIEYVINCYHCGSQLLFQNLQTGAANNDLLAGGHLKLGRI